MMDDDWTKLPEGPILLVLNVVTGIQFLDSSMVVSSSNGLYAQATKK